MGTELIEVKVDKTDAAVTSQLSYAATVHTVKDSNEDFKIVDIFLRASNISARVELSDFAGNDYLAYRYNLSDTPKSIQKRADGTPDYTGVSIPINSVDSNILQVQLVLKKEFDNIPLKVTVTAQEGVYQEYTLRVYQAFDDFSDLLVNINGTDNGFRMVKDSADTYRYLVQYGSTAMSKPVSDVTADYLSGKNMVYYVSDGFMGEPVGIAYLLAPTTPNFREKFDHYVNTSIPKVYYEVIFPVGTSQVQLAATYADVEQKLRNASGPLRISVGTDASGNWVTSTLTANNQWAENRNVMLTGADTRVPIQVDFNGTTKTFYAMVRKNALDERLDYIRVDGKDLTLNLEADDNGEMILTGHATVYNESRYAKIEVKASASTSALQLSRVNYLKYEMQNGQLTPTQMVSFNPVNDRGYLALDADSINDGTEHNVFMVELKTSDNKTYHYRIIINYVNQPIQLDRLIVYDNELQTGGTTLKDVHYQYITTPKGQKYVEDTTFGNSADALPLSPTFVAGTNIFDYTVGCEEEKTLITLVADAQESNLHYQEAMREIYTAQYDPASGMSLDDFLAASMYGEEIILKVDPENTLGLDASASQPVPSIPVNQPQDYPEIGGAVLPQGTATPAYVIWERQIDMTDRDIITIPVVMEVVKSGYSKTYTISYHRLSDDATLKPDEWGVLGRNPNEENCLNDPNIVDQRIYEVDHAVNVAEIYAIANHNHELNTTLVTLKAYNEATGAYETLTTNVGEIHHQVTLKDGLNRYQIIVTAEDGYAHKEYEITIKRKQADLGLQWVRIANANSSKESNASGENVLRNADGSYTAYVMAGAIPRLTAKVKDQDNSRAQFFMMSNKPGAPANGQGGTQSNKSDPIAVFNYGHEWNYETNLPSGVTHDVGQYGLNERSGSRYRRRH